MNRSWMARAKALAATTALACMAAVVTTAAQADFNYTYSFTPTSATMFGPVTGSFTTDYIIGTSSTSNVTSGNYSFNYGGQTYSGNIKDSYFVYGSGFSLQSPPDFFIRKNGSVTPVAGSFSTQAELLSNSLADSTSGLFSAVFTPSSGGGGGGGAGGGSGGAPTPEGNAGLGILIAGASFAFLRRKRGTRHEATAA